MATEITKEQIVELNKSIVKEFGGSIGLQNEGNLDFVLAKVRIREHSEKYGKEEV